MHKCLYIFILGCFLFSSRLLFAADDKTKNSTTQQVGGLLFDVDEGVKIEHGPGGSVYLKSNKEFMQEKLKSVDEKIESLEKRVGALETALAEEKKKKNPEAASAAGAANAETPATAVVAEVSSAGKRVLVT